MGELCRETLRRPPLLPAPSSASSLSPFERLGVLGSEVSGGIQIGGPGELEEVEGGCVGGPTLCGSKLNPPLRFDQIGHNPSQTASIGPGDHVKVLCGRRAEELRERFDTRAGEI
jgi:hypothetical protein